MSNKKTKERLGRKLMLAPSSVVLKRSIVKIEKLSYTESYLLLPEKRLEALWSQT